MKNKAAFLVEPGRVELMNCKFPEMREGDLLIEMDYVGICGSDLHFYQHGRIGRRVLTEPFILGHECSGVVREVGAAVTGFSAGERVTIEPGIGCGHCKFCRSGRYNICPNVKFLSSPPDHGVMRQWVAYPAEACFKLPQKVSQIEGAMIEPLSVGVHAAARAQMNVGDTVMIQGAGCIGIMILLVCKSMGMKTIINDVSTARLKKAKALGADHCVNGAEENVPERVLGITDGAGADVVFEAAGNPKTALQAIELIRRGGRIIQVGNITRETPYIFNELSRLEVDIRTTFRYCNDFQTAIDLVERGGVDLKEVMPKIYPFGEASQAFRNASCDADNATKYMIKF